MVPPAPESLRGGGGEDQPKKPIDGRVIVEALRQSGLTSSALANPGFAKPSHELVVCDGTEPARFVYVEERDCIGCTHCATTARGTFFMEGMGFEQKCDIVCGQRHPLKNAADSPPGGVFCFVFASFALSLAGLWTRRDWAYGAVRS